ncbi:hypothetical protein [Streptomyces sp. NPDC093568]|uniref:hypothetical protein n=1 Tax=Streptomyces sp. NPDC093568 TaxID=3366041 RepID=UPI003806115E
MGTTEANVEIRRSDRRNAGWLGSRWATKREATCLVGEAASNTVSKNASTGFAAVATEAPR